MNRPARLSLAISPLLFAASALPAQEAPRIELPQTRTMPGSGPALIVYAIGTPRCDDGAATPVELVAPYGSAQGMQYATIAPVELSFRIDADGRARGIERHGNRFAWPLSDDAAPALAASRFAANQPHARCTISYAGKSIPLAQASAAQLGAFYAIPHSDKSQDRAVWRALQGPQSTCYQTRLQPRVVHYPDRKLPERVGLPDYAVIGFDVDKAGKSIGVHTIVSSGNTAYDRSVIAAAAATEFEPGSPRTGCVARFGKGPKTPLPAPARDMAMFKPAEACKDEPAWKKMPPLRFPPNFARRAIQGWAVIGFDIAPWGAVGNVKVLASEPADDFGIAARAIVETAQKPSSDRGYTGCIQAVSFKIADRQGDENGELDDADVTTH